jgi:predicted nucleic acid-binding protein
MARPRDVVLIDTSAWIEALRRGGRRDLHDRVRALLLDGRAAWSEIVQLELWSGARGDAEKKMLTELDETLVLLPANAEVWARAYALAKRARARGKAIPATNVLVHATARHHGARLEHCDDDLAALAALDPS